MKKLPDEWSLSFDQVNQLEFELESENEQGCGIWSCAFKTMVDNRTALVHTLAANDIFREDFGVQGQGLYNWGY